MIVTRMKKIVGRIFLNQFSGKEWLLSEAIVDLVRIYIYWSGDDADDNVSKHLDTMVEERGNSPDAENLCSNLFELHFKMTYRVKDNITNVLAKMLQILAPKKDHYWFALFLEPQYVMELKDFKNFYQSKNVDTKVLDQKTMPKFYEYIMDAELYVHPNTPNKVVHNNE